jgi:hypothetical protein
MILEKHLLKNLLKKLGGLFMAMNLKDQKWFLKFSKDLICL